jgi:micrococcal nuclease
MRRRRSKSIAWTVALLVTAIVLWQLRPWGPDGPYRVVGIADGDTISVLVGSVEERVRLAGVDTPERGQPFGARAKEFTGAACFGEFITLLPEGRDRYDRIVADVILPDGKSLSRELVRAGLAWHYKQYSDDRTLTELEDEARQAGRGLWSDPDPTPPWEWRRRRREGAPAGAN